MQEEHDFNKAVDHFHDEVFSVLDAHAPRTLARKRFPAWFNSGIISKLRVKRKLEKKPFKSESNNFEFISFQSDLVNEQFFVLIIS